MDSNILVCIFNYRHDENAKRLLGIFSPYFETVVLDSGNDHEDNSFIQFPNIYYTGLFNKMKKLASKNNYKFICQICSDIEIDDINANKLILKMLNLLDSDTIGIWQPGVVIDWLKDKKSRKSWTYKPIMATDNILLSTNIIEGWMHIIRKDILEEN